MAEAGGVTPAGASLHDTASEAAEAGGTAVVLSRAKEGGWQARATLIDSSGPAAMRFCHFALQVRSALHDKGVGSVLIASALPGEGKTLVACNLALALATMGEERRVALVDLDLRRPTVSSVMAATPRVGIESVLRGETDLATARLSTDISALDLFLPEGRVPHAHKLLADSDLQSLIDELSKDYGTVVLDTPPTIIVPDVELISPHVGACVLVARAGMTTRSSLREMISLLPREKLIGSFLNFRRSPKHADAYEYYTQDEAEDT